MATKASKSSRTSRQRSKPKESGAAPKARKGLRQTSGPKSEASNRFVRDLVVRGEAAKPDSQGKLPLDATHGVVKESKDGTVTVKRARFKYF
ncbi:MAG TPA: hypothetical protein VGN86_06265 [Pyrinomonadaceae bacterium]|jgi:hypothetical protein|nr:hypothetical protein [Pyrinomonadaceae bacterium]